MRMSSVGLSQVEGAFVMLVGPGKGEELGRSLGELYANVLAEHPRPVILFYGDDVNAEERNKTGVSLSTPVTGGTAALAFAAVNFSAHGAGACAVSVSGP